MMPMRVALISVGLFQVTHAAEETGKCLKRCWTIARMIVWPGSTVSSCPDGGLRCLSAY